MFAPFLKEGLIAKACKSNYITVKIHDLRDYAQGRHSKVDDTPFGGGGGMVMMATPIINAVGDIKQEEGETRIVIFSPRGKKFNQQTASDFSKVDQIIMICGRYEGIDERIYKYLATDRLSVGNYVLMGGEVPAMIVLESVSRLIKGVVGKDSFLEERVKEQGFLEYPQYTKPEEIIINNKKRGVPKALLSGNHQKINEWKTKKGKIIR